MPEGMKRKRAFTLIELIVVIAIIAILAAIIAPNAFRAIEKAKIAKVEGDLKAIKTAALAYYADTGRFPPDDDIYIHQGFHPGRGIDFLKNMAGISGWDGPYLERWPNNPYWKAPWGSQEEGYQWEGAGPTASFDFDGDGIADSCVEMGFVELSTQAIADICTKIDKHIDDGNLTTGIFRLKLPTGGRLAYYRVVY